MMKTTKHLVHLILIPTILLTLLTACSLIIGEQQSSSTEVPTNNQGTNGGENPPQNQQNQNQQNQNQGLLSQTQDGFTVTITNVTTMGNNVKIHFTMNNQSTDKVLTQLGISQVEQNGQIYKVVDPYNREYLQYPNGDEDSLAPGQSGQGYVVFQLPDPKAPFTFKFKPYSFANQNMEAFMFNITP